MSLPIVMTSAAQREFDDAADWYEEQVGLGSAFTDAVKSVFDRISEVPLLHQTVYKDIRRGVVRRFPYCIYYRVRPDRIEVISVFHSKRDPAIWQSRA
jgi:plasmid stabilization system protein ParE